MQLGDKVQFQRNKPGAEWFAGTVDGMTPDFVVVLPDDQPDLRMKFGADGASVWPDGYVLSAK